MDFFLNDQDLAIQNGDISLCGTADATAQAISIRLKTFAGEWFLNTDVGLPYLTQIFGRKNSQRFLRRLVSDALKGLPDVMEVKDLLIEEGQEPRSMVIKFQAVLTSQSTLNINENIGV